MQGLYSQETSRSFVKIKALQNGEIKLCRLLMLVDHGQVANFLNMAKVSYNAIYENENLLKISKFTECIISGQISFFFLFASIKGKCLKFYIIC